MSGESDVARRRRKKKGVLRKHMKMLEQRIRGTD